MRLRLSASLVLLVLAAGCIHRVTPPTEALEKAAAGASPGSSARTLSLAGYHALLMQGDAARSRELFDQALAAKSSEPYALYGQALLALRVAHPERALTAALDLCERAPNHPLAGAAARLVLDLGGLAQSTDDVIRMRAPGLMASLRGDASPLLRSALANALMDQGQPDAQRAVLADLGVPTTATLVGPFSAWHLLGMQAPTAPEKSGSLDGLGAGPFGPLAAREVKFADGRFSLAGEPAEGDVYLFAVDVTVAERGLYVLRTITSMDHVAVLDGATVLSRSTWERPAPTLVTRALTLKPGTHRLIVRMAKENQAGNFTLMLHRWDGAPANLTFAPARGPAPSWTGEVDLDDDVELVHPSAASLRAALEDEVGGALASFIAARDGMGRDPDGARALAASLPESVNGPAVSVLRADLALQDRAVPSRVGRGRATRDLEAALTKDRGYVAAQMATAQLALEDGRQLDALEQLKTARTQAPPGGPLLELQARVELALGLDAQSAVTAREAEEKLPGLCDALVHQYDLARRRDASAEADALLEKSRRCPGAVTRKAEHARSKGDAAGAIAAYESLLGRDEGQVGVAMSLVNLLVSQKRFDDAVARLQRLIAQWPRNAMLYKALGDVHEHAGRMPEALAAREKALLLDGDDLALRRAVERQKTGKELLDDYAISTEEALKSYEAAPGSEDATSTYVLDAAAIQAFPDGSMVDRIHIIQKALDQQGVQDVAEVSIPADATVLKLRTLKPDGRSLEPESIEGKEGISLPGVQVGDLVEYEFLLSHAPRGPGQPGFVASNFYFQIARQPNSRSTYVVLAPKGTGLKVDAHNMDAPPPRVEGEYEVFRHEERRVPPYIPEPMGPPSANEWLPFVSVGAGQTGNEGVVTAYADAFLDKGAITAEVEAFAKGAAKDLKNADAVRAVYVAVMDKLSGQDQGLSISAAASVAQDRGSRTWLLASSLRALGFDVRLVAVRAFTADPAPYLFPAEGLLPYVCVRATTPAGEVLWLDPMVRFAPFGELPEFAMGEREAYLLPEPGKPLEKVKTPPASTRPGKTVTLDMTLSEDGVLTGSGMETYSGYEAAELAEALESISPDQRDQALQAALSRYFGGADLSALEVDTKRQVGSTVVVKYKFTARRFARVEGPGKLVAGSLTFPFLLGRRFVATSARVTSLMLRASEASATRATMKLPKGWSLQGPVGELKLSGPAGQYVRREQQKDGVLSIEEDFRLSQARIVPAKYEAFAQFCGEVDLVQQRDVLFEKHK